MPLSATTWYQATTRGWGGNHPEDTIQAMEILAEVLQSSLENIETRLESIEDAVREGGTREGSMRSA